jgi:hypothetical protein
MTNYFKVFQNKQMKVGSQLFTENEVIQACGIVHWACKINETNPSLTEQNFLRGYLHVYAVTLLTKNRYFSVYNGSTSRRPVNQRNCGRLHKWLLTYIVLCTPETTKTILENYKLIIAHLIGPIPCIISAREYPFCIDHVRYVYNLYKCLKSLHTLRGVVLI